MDLNTALNFAGVVFTGINILITSRLGYSYIKLESKLSTKSNLKITDYNEFMELRTKMHDRVTEIILSIRDGEKISKTLEKRVRLTSSRISIYTDNIFPDVYSLINDWNNILFLHERKEATNREFSKTRGLSIQIANRILKNIDETVKKFKE